MNKRAQALSADDGGEIIDLGAMFGMVWRGKWVIAICMALSLAVGIWIAYIKTVPLYAAEATLVLETRDEQVVDITSVLGGLSATTEVIRTEVFILNGQQLMRQVVERLNLIEDPEFNGDLRAASFDLIGAAKQAVKDAIQRVVAINETIDPVSSGNVDDPLNNIVQSLSSKVSIRNLPDTYLFSILVQTEDPYKSALIANTIVDLYIENQVAIKLDVTEQATGWLAERVAELRANLGEAEDTVSQLRSQTDLTDEVDLRAVETRLLGLRDTLASQTANLEAQRAQVEALEAARDSETSRALAIQAGYASVLARASSPEAGLQAVRVAAAADLDSQQARVDTLAASVSQLEQRVRTQTESLATLSEAERDLEARRLLFETFQNRLRETSVQKGLLRPDSRIVSTAIPPRQPTVPQKSKILALSIILGGFAGAAIALLWQITRPVIRTEGQIALLTRVPVLISLSRIRGRFGPAQVNRLGPGTRGGEAIRNLRTSMTMLHRDAGSQVILLTSPDSGDGKSTICAALARNFADIGKRVLLIDADMRRHSLSDSIGTGTAPSGLPDVLSGRLSLTEAASPAKVGGFDLLSAGSAGVHAADILGGGDLVAFFTQARAAWDVIILDTPPVGLVPDARILATHADTLVLVATGSRTRRNDLLHSLDQLDKAGHPANGIVLNRSSAPQRKTYGYSRREKAYFRG